MLKNVPALLLSLGALAASACVASDGASPDDGATGGGDGKADGAGSVEVGVLLGSHCDIDDIDAELEPYVKSAFIKNNGIPLPDWSREPLSGIAYALAVDNVRSQYDAIGPTHYRANARRQAEAVTAALRAAGIKGKAYLGCDFTWPSIPDALDQMRRDGVKKVVLFNKGAQYSTATGGEHLEDAVAYLADHPTWHPQRFVMVKEFSSDPRFRTLLGDVIQRDVDAAFPGAPKQDVCILVASHGLPLRLVELGDPATGQMLDVVDDLKRRFAAYDLRHGFLNDDFFPGAAWTTPKAIDVAADLRAESCPNIYLDARLSFTTHHRATLFDLNVEARAVLEEPDLQPDGTPHPLYTPPKIVFGKQWDAEPGLARLYAALTKEALARANPANLVEVTATTEVPSH